MDGGGFEPPKALLTDLQSAPFGHSGTHPGWNITLQRCAFSLNLFTFVKCSVQADDRTRTDNLLITNQLLCQLSHIGINGTNRTRTYDPLLVRQMLSQLSYDPIMKLCINRYKRPGRDSNPRPPPWQGGALTNWATGPYTWKYFVPSKPHTRNLVILYP